LAFIESTQPEEVRHFGLQVLQHVVTKEWPSVTLNYQTTQTRTKFGQLLLDYASRGTKHMLDEQVFIKEKVAVILSSIVELTWPKV